LLSDPVLNNLCDSLSLEDLNSLRIATHQSALLCPVQISDPNNYLTSLPRLDDFYLKLARQIQFGSADALIWAIETHNLPALEELLKLGVPANFWYVDSETEIWSPLLIAVHLGFEEAIRLLLKYGARPDANLNHSNFLKSTPLTEVLTNSYTHLYSIPESGLQYPDSRDFLVVPSLDQDEWDEFIEEGPPSANIPGYRELRSIDLAEFFDDQGKRLSLDEYVYLKQIRILDQLLATGAKLNSENPRDPNPLGYYLEYGNLDSRIIRYLVERGTLLNQQIADNSTILMEAVKRGDPETIRLLLELGANPHFQNSEGVSALEFARRYDLNLALPILEEYAE